MQGIYGGADRQVQSSGRMNILTRALRRLGGGHQDSAALASEVANLRKEVRHLTSLVQEVRSSQELLPKLLGSEKNDAKWRSIFRAQMGALLRAQYLHHRPELTGVAGIRARRFRLRSQNEEDGLVLAILDEAGSPTRTFVEIGSGGTGGNSAVLAYELGWRGLMIEASKNGAHVARDLFRHNPEVVVLQKFALTDNINSLITRSGFGGEVDLLSIDVDSIDYWLFDALDVERVRPRLIVTEYNAHFGPDRAVTLPNVPVSDTAPKPYFGASLAAMTKVAERKGYRLLLCEENGINAFFLRNDLAPSLPGATAHQAYRPMRRRLGADHDESQMDDVYALAAKHNLPLVDV